jgi:flagellin FlaB
MKMRLLRKLLKNKKGVVGIEAAIVLIAFVIIAAALAYVVINMGFFATQKTKETIGQGIEEATSALQLDGSVIGKTGSSANISYIVFPVKLSVGRSAVDLSNGSVVISVYLPNATLLNIYNGTYQGSSPTELDLTALGMGDDTAVVIFYNNDDDTVLESKEKAFVVVHLGSNHELSDYETIKIEIKTGTGAALTVVRTAPGGMPANAYVDLG